VAHNSAEHSALTLYFLDSHSHSPDPEVDGYDWIKDYQVEWFKEKHNSLKEEHAKYSYIHLDMAFSVAHESVRRAIEPDLSSVSPGRVQTLL
jgi:hypothetical protein